MAGPLGVLLTVVVAAAASTGAVSTLADPKEQYDPLGQGAQIDWPDWEAKVLTRHGRQLLLDDAPASAENVPLGHPMHCDRSGRPKVPASQITQPPISPM